MIVVLSLAYLSIPTLMCCMGVVMWKKTPSKNNFVGWRTSTAMKDEESFRRINKYGGKIWSLWGSITMIISIISLVILIKLRIDLIFILVGVSIQLLVMIFSVVWVEKNKNSIKD